MLVAKLVKFRTELASSRFKVLVDYKLQKNRELKGKNVGKSRLELSLEWSIISSSDNRNFVRLA